MDSISLIEDEQKLLETVLKYWVRSPYLFLWFAFKLGIVLQNPSPSPVTWHCLQVDDIVNCRAPNDVQIVGELLHEEDPPLSDRSGVPRSREEQVGFPVLHSHGHWNLADENLDCTPHAILLERNEASSLGPLHSTVLCSSEVPMMGSQSFIFSQE